MYELFNRMKSCLLMLADNSIMTVLNENLVRKNKGAIMKIPTNEENKVSHRLFSK